jgi:hypothetical protein
MYEDQRVTKMDILYEKSKKEYPKSVTIVIRLEQLPSMNQMGTSKRNTKIPMKGL